MTKMGRDGHSGRSGRRIFMDDALAASLEREFNRLAEHGIVGDPRGELAYGYLRVSSRSQAEEDRSGLPRQLEHIAEKAARDRLAIPWDMLYCDDHTGFTFEDRPGINQLLADIKAAPRAGKLVIEYPDRMSRDHAWRYGYLREQFQTLGVSYVYWQGYHSEIERSVMGAVSEQGMRKELERLHYGTLSKARSGRVTAKTPAYGYQFVDSQGRDRTDPKSKWRTDTHYAIRDAEAEVVRLMYDQLAYAGMSLIALGNHLNERRIPPPKKSSLWEPVLLSKMIRNPVYKGELVAHRWFYKKIWSERSHRLVTRKFARPAEEWILVPVPPIVSDKTWNLAQTALNRNSPTATRNTHYDYLLTGLLTCAGCGYAYSTSTSVTRRKGKTYIGLTYRCGPKRCGIKAVRDRIGCTQSQISARILDRSIWQALSALLVTPELLDQAMNDYCADTDLELTHSQVRFIEQQIARYQQEDERLYRAYIQGAFDEQEFADRRRGGRVAVAALRAEEKALVAQIVSREEFAGRRRQMIRDLVAELRSDPGAPDLPLGTKRRIARMMVDDIQLNVNEGWFKASGTLRGTFSIRTGESIVGCDPST